MTYYYIVKAAKLADTTCKLTVGSSDNNIDKIVFEALCQFDPVPAFYCKKRPKIDSKESDGFAAITTYSLIQQIRQDAIQ